MIKSKFGVISWYIIFFLISCACGFHDKNIGPVVFLATCVILPFYFCHFLSGYLIGRMGRSFQGNLLINLQFLKFLKTQGVIESDINDEIGVFFYGTA